MKRFVKKQKIGIYFNPDQFNTLTELQEKHNYSTYTKTIVKALDYYKNNPCKIEELENEMATRSEEHDVLKEGLRRLFGISSEKKQLAEKLQDYINYLNTLI